MKKIKLIIIVTIINLSSLIAQNFQSVNSNRIAFFKNQSGNVNCLRIDSVKFQVDSIYYLSSNIQQLDYDCFTPYGDSWIGKKIIAGNKDYDYFFNRTHDTIKIRKKAKLNENWVAYELIDSIKIIAEVIKYDTLGFLGLKDSVKTIGFQVYDESMSPVSHDLNNKSIILSKNYGLIKTLNFYLFPDYQNGYLHNYQLEEYDLAGLTNPKLGIQNLEWFDVHDFQVGDELHIYYEVSDYLDEEYGYINTKKTIDKYLERINYDDSIVYVIERKQSRHFSKNDSNSFTHDTIKSVILQNPIFNKLPGETIISEYEAYSHYMTIDNNISKTEPPLPIWPLYNDSCWTDCCADGCFPEYKYIKGLGGPYYKCSNAFSYGGMENKLVYYRKEQIIWGTPLIITGNSEISIESKIELYPNPAKDIVWIKTTSENLPCSIELLNLKGQVLMIKEINSELTGINVKQFTAGIYLFRIINNGKVSIIKYIIN